MSKFKVGDKVSIRQRKAIDRVSEDNKVGYAYMVEDMKEHCGKVAKITEVRRSTYAVDIDGGRWDWTDEMFEGYAFEYGDLIEVSYEGKSWIMWAT